MRAELRKVEITKTVYVASDEKEFESAVECRAHEEDLKSEEDQKVFESLNKFRLTPYYSDGDYAWTWCEIKSQEEFDAVHRALFCQDGGDPGFRISSFPRWIRFSVDDDGYGEVDDAETVLNEIESFVASARKNMLDKPKGEVQ